MIPLYKISGEKMIRKQERPELLPGDCKYDENIKAQIRSYKVYKDDLFLQYFLGFEQIALYHHEKPSFSFYEDGILKIVTLNGMLRSIYMSKSEEKDESIKFSKELIDKIRYNVILASLYQVFQRDNGGLAYHKDSCFAALKGIGFDFSLCYSHGKIYDQIVLDFARHIRIILNPITVRVPRFENDIQNRFVPLLN
ncbi:MAG: hypothetical protein LCH54_13610 [Bacteroidetes bacterium]|nr:hypothetical protein [Bacteroidota bacterium]